MKDSRNVKPRLRENWYNWATEPTKTWDSAGIYQWSIDGVGVYVGKARILRRRIRDYPRNVRALIQGRPWHGNPLKEYRGIHRALREAHDLGTPVTVTVLEVCDPAIRAERERYWIDRRRREAEQGGPAVLNA